MNKKLVASIGIVIAIFAVVLYFSREAKANPIQLATPSNTSATTSVSYMTAGTATTTYSYDSYSQGNPTRPYEAALLINFTGSSTSATLNINIEYSQDGIDWYQDGGSLYNAYATSSKPFDVGTVNRFTYTYTTQGAGLAAGTNATSTRLVLVKTPTRYVRAVMTLPTGSAAGAVWATFIPSKERAE